MFLLSGVFFNEDFIADRYFYSGSASVVGFVTYGSYYWGAYTVFKVTSIFTLFMFKFPRTKLNFFGAGGFIIYYFKKNFKSVIIK